MTEHTLSELAYQVLVFPEAPSDMNSLLDELYAGRGVLVDICSGMASAKDAVCTAAFVHKLPAVAWVVALQKVVVAATPESVTLH